MNIQRSGTPILFFSKKEKEMIESAIRQAETKTSAEIRVHLQRVADEDLMAHTKRVFEKLGMTKTKLRNAVLIFMGVKSRRFVIMGDDGIHIKVPNDYWGELTQKMMVYFKEDRFADGLSYAIHELSIELSKYYPSQLNDVNEINNEISFSA